MIVEYILFIIFAIIAIVSAGCVVTLRNPVHCAVALIITLLQIAALFLLLRSPFLAVVQVFIYVGAVMVLFLFAVFLIDVKKAAMDMFKPKFRPLAYVAALILLVESLAVIFGGGIAELTKITEAGGEVKVEVIGRALFTTYIFPFEIVSIVLLAAMVGAIVMARDKKE